MKRPTPGNLDTGGPDVRVGRFAVGGGPVPSRREPCERQGTEAATVRYAASRVTATSAG
jgi:hypothetical protein